jgi:hypothetical protein
MLPPMSTSASQTLGGAARTALALLVLNSGGCAYGELRHVLRSQVAAETNCPEIAVVKSPPYQPGYKEHQYLVKGCGIDRIYNCRKEGLTKYGHAECTYVEGSSTFKPPAAAAPGPSLDEPAELSPLETDAPASGDTTPTAEPGGL